MTFIIKNMAAGYKMRTTQWHGKASAMTQAIVAFAWKKE